ncbi:D2-like protein, partial [Mya arenaria]
TSEDCLYLNVWTPLDANVTSGYPVMAFLHGGATGNYGILDQRLALQWIQTNIDAFGGDPFKVTLFGQSAGAQSVFIHVMSPPSNSLFRAAIVESAPFAVPYRTKDEARLLATKFRELLKCREGDFQCLLNKTVEEINDAQQDVTFKITGGKLDEYFEPIGPVVDGVDVPMQPMAAARLGKFRKLPLMLGTVTEEGRLFVYGAWKLNLKRTEYEAALAAIHPSHFEEVETEYPPSDVPDLRDELCEVVTDYLFTCATRNVSENILKGGNSSTFLYVFDHATNGTGGWGKDTFCEGHVCHAEELAYIFQNSWVKGTPDEGTLSQLMVLYWSNFAHSMNPSVGPRSPLLRWFPYSPGSKTIMHFKTPTPECITQFRKQQCDFWDTVGYEL